MENSTQRHTKVNCLVEIFPQCGQCLLSKKKLAILLCSWYPRSYNRLKRELNSVHGIQTEFTPKEIILLEAWFISYRNGNRQIMKQTLCI